jgi:hypothetical protein
MLIGGYQPCSFCDYPGHVAAVIFTQGCNFRCPFCHNGALLPAMVPAESLLSEKEVLDRLRHRRGQLDAVVVSGGEPTLHADLPSRRSTSVQVSAIISPHAAGASSTSSRPWPFSSVVTARSSPTTWVSGRRARPSSPSGVDLSGSPNLQRVPGL